jgi:hypothetical protein
MTVIELIEYLEKLPSDAEVEKDSYTSSEITEILFSVKENKVVLS